MAFASFVQRRQIGKTRMLKKNCKERTVNTFNLEEIQTEPREEFFFGGRGGRVRVVGELGGTAL